MSLMSRIKVKDFLSMTYEEQLDFVKSVQAKRIQAIALSKLKPVRKTNKAKSAKAKVSADPIAALAKHLKKLTPDQIDSIKASFGIK